MVWSFLSLRLILATPWASDINLVILALSPETEFSIVYSFSASRSVKARLTWYWSSVFSKLPLSFFSTLRSTYLGSSVCSWPLTNFTLTDVLFAGIRPVCCSFLAIKPLVFSSTISYLAVLGIPSRLIDSLWARRTVALPLSKTTLPKRWTPLISLPLKVMWKMNLLLGAGPVSSWKLGLPESS